MVHSDRAVEVWDRWQRGESSQSIGRVLDRGGSAIHRQLAVYGGIRPQSRCRSSRALTLVEREEISRGIAAKESVRSIAVRLGRSPSTVSREVSRNGGSDSYRASEADERTWERARRPKSCRLARSPRLRQLVEEKLRQVWSPEQIAGWLKHSYPEDESLHVSHETIYRCLGALLWTTLKESAGYVFGQKITESMKSMTYLYLCTKAAARRPRCELGALARRYQHPRRAMSAVILDCLIDAAGVVCSVSSGR